MISHKITYFAGENRVTTPTTTESVLPWKRDDDKGDNGAIQQTEFPSWANNKVLMENKLERIKLT